MERVEKTNMEMVYSNQRTGFAQCSPYIMEVDRSNRNYYSCEGFGHLARNCRNKENRIGKRGRLEYEQRLITEENNRQSNLNKEGDLVVLD